jgi:hypothetical protein
MVMLFCNGCCRRSSVGGFVIGIVQTSFWSTIDCASSVSYCVTVFACCLVLIIVCWNVSTLWSSLYAPHCAISNRRLVILLPLSFVAGQPSGMCFIISIYCLSVQVARSFDKREIVWGWEHGARVAGKHRRLRPFGIPPPVVGGGVRFVYCLLSEQMPTPLRIHVSRSELNNFLVLCSSSGIMFVLL